MRTEYSTGTGETTERLEVEVTLDEAAAAAHAADHLERLGVDLGELPLFTLLDRVRRAHLIECSPGAGT